MEPKTEINRPTRFRQSLNGEWLEARRVSTGAWKITTSVGTTFALGSRAAVLKFANDYFAEYA